jgi:ABC-type Mn2+/Zn2+ transport system permease subunit
MLTKRLDHMMLLAISVAVGASITGLYASFYLNVSSGAAIVLTCTVGFALTWLVQRMQGAA